MNKKQIDMFKKFKEDDIPITRNDDGIPMTPYYIYNNKKRMRPSMSSQPDFDLLEQRIKKKVEKGMVKPIYRMDGEYSPERQLEEVQNKTKFGYELMLAEKGLLDYLLAYE